MLLKITNNRTGIDRYVAAKIITEERAPKTSCEIEFDDGDGLDAFWIPSVGCGKISSTLETFELVEFHPADKKYMKVYPMFVIAVAEQMAAGYDDYVRDCQADEQEILPFADWVNGLVGNHCDMLAEELARDIEDYVKREM